MQLGKTRIHFNARDARWCQRISTRAFACPDGVTRCVTIANWKWKLMDWASDDKGVAQYAARCWMSARRWGGGYDEIVFALLMEEATTSLYRILFYHADNDNVGLLVFRLLPSARVMAF